MTHRAFLSITAGALLTLAGPAFAQSQAPLSNSSAEAEQTHARARANQRICVLQETTGTRLQRRVCRTREQWNREGGVPTEESR